MRNDFAVFILTHGRADRMYTMEMLKKGNYTGKWYLILDDMDDQLEQYKEKFGADHCIVFDKEAAYKRTDTMDNFHTMNVILYARNECWSGSMSIK